MDSKQWHVYSVDPIDYRWDQLNTLNETLKRWVNDSMLMAVDEATVLSDIKTLLTDWESAQQAALENGWDGDFREGFEARVLWFPGEGRFDYGFVFKQNHNGITFVLAPQRLPALESS